MVNRSYRAAAAFGAGTLLVVAALLGGCAGSGAGLDDNGDPLGSTPGSEPLTADFQSIQDNVFTPICTRCHSGAGAPEGLQLDAAHSYALLVGVPSAEVPSLLRVKPGDPSDSYLIQKLQGASGIVGVQMPFGGPYLPQATIDIIQQWITNGAPAPAATPTAPALAVTASTPVDRTAMTAPLANIAIGFNRELDASHPDGAIQVQNITSDPFDVSVLIVAAEGNPSTLLLRPATPLPPGSYRVTLRGGVGSALSAVSGESLSADYSFIFTVDEP